MSHLSVEALQRQIDHGAQPDASTRQSLSTGCEALDRLLPDGGFRSGSLVEWLSEQAGWEAASLSMRIAAHLSTCSPGRSDSTSTFHPLASK